MKRRKIKQTKFGGPDAPLDEQGNCLPACVATIFGISLRRAERYLDGVKTVAQAESEWWQRFVMWCAEELAVVPLYLPWGTKATPEQYAWSRPGLIYIANGKSARGLDHSVVYCDGQMIHDPHPDGTGIKEPESYILFALPRHEGPGFWIGKARREASVRLPEAGT